MNRADGSYEHAYDTVRDVFIKGLYEYLDEQLDARNALLGLLLKYKHRSEWFRRGRLRQIAKEGLEKESGGERALAIDLQEYVYDQGVEYTIEPTSASGEPDCAHRPNWTADSGPIGPSIPAELDRRFRPNWTVDSGRIGPPIPARLDRAHP
jgi:hypothetical protein